MKIRKKDFYNQCLKVYVKLGDDNDKFDKTYSIVRSKYDEIVTDRQYFKMFYDWWLNQKEKYKRDKYEKLFIEKKIKKI